MHEEQATALLESLRTLPYGFEPVDQLAHALQTASAAMRSGAGDELIVAAAFHDIGRAPAVATRYPRVAHEESGAAFLAEYFGERVTAPVALHVSAKRYLVATEADYASTLSAASVESLARQGGPMTRDEIATFEALPYAREAVALRRWDETAKIHGAAVPHIAEIVAVVGRLATARRSHGAPRGNG